MTSTSRRSRPRGTRSTLKANIGSSEIIYKALQSGQIQMYPEYTGTLLTAIAGDTKPPDERPADLRAVQRLRQEARLHPAEPDAVLRR